MPTVFTDFCPGPDCHRYRWIQSTPGLILGTLMYFQAYFKTQKMPLLKSELQYSLEAGKLFLFFATAENKTNIYCFIGPLWMDLSIYNCWEYVSLLFCILIEIPGTWAKEDLDISTWEETAKQEKKRSKKKQVVKHKKVAHCRENMLGRY